MRLSCLPLYVAEFRELFRGGGVMVMTRRFVSNVPSHDEAAWVRRAQAGEADAFAELIRKAAPKALRVTRAVLGDIAEADDAVQETFLLVWQRLHSLAEPYHFVSWVSQIARNTARNMARRRRRTMRNAAFATSVALATPDHHDDELTDRIAATVRALAQLPPPLREAARLSYLVGHRQHEVARRLHVPLGTVKSRLANSRKIIRERMDTMSSAPDRVIGPITITQRPGESMRVLLRGYGLAFGSMLEVGDVEIVGFYDYPGGVLTGITRTEVRQVTHLCGRRCFEVRITSSQCDPPEPVEVDYFQVRDDGIGWLLRVRGSGETPDAFPDVNTDVHTEQPTPLRRDTAAPAPNTDMRVVDVTVGDESKGRCLAVLERDDDGTAAELFYQPDGRCVLHRRYVGPDATYGDYPHLPPDDTRDIQGKPYRHWYDTVLLQP